MKSIFITLLFFYPILSNGLSIVKDYSDTLHPTYLRKNVIELNYGKDDSSKALIKYFFRKEKSAEKELILWSIIAVVVVLSVLLLFSTTNLGIVGFLLFVDLVVAAYMAAFELIFNLAKAIIFNKKRLIKLLNRYQRGYGIPNSIAKRKAFRKELNFLKK